MQHNFKANDIFMLLYKKFANNSKIKVNVKSLKYYQKNYLINWCLYQLAEILK